MAPEILGMAWLTKRLRTYVIYVSIQSKANGLETCNFGLIKCLIYMRYQYRFYDIATSPGSPTLIFTLMLEDNVGMEIAPRISES